MSIARIAASLPAEQYQELESLRRTLKLKRSEAVQEALELWLGAHTRDARIERYLRGYLRHPDDPAAGKALAKAWAKGRASEEWS